MVENFEELDYARAGTRATDECEVLAGPVEGPTGPMPHTLEPALRAHGMPTRLNKGEACTAWPTRVMAARTSHGGKPTNGISWCHVGM